MRWLVIPFLVALTIALGASYSSTLIYSFMGPWSATAVEQDGSLTHMQFGQHLPRPSWVPVYPGAWVVQAATLTSASMPGGAHSLDLGTRASLDEVKRFYTAELTASGFVVEDLGLMSLNPATAHLLGIAGTLSARRAATDDQIEILVRTSDGADPIAHRADPLAQDQRNARVHAAGVAFRSGGQILGAPAALMALWTGRSRADSMLVRGCRVIV